MFVIVNADGSIAWGTRFFTRESAQELLDWYKKTGYAWTGGCRVAEGSRIVNSRGIVCDEAAKP